MADIKQIFNYDKEYTFFEYEYHFAIIELTLKRIKESNIYPYNVKPANDLKDDM